MLVHERAIRYAGRRHGRGKLKLATGDTFTGEFSNGQPHGMVCGHGVGEKGSRGRARACACVWVGWGVMLRGAQGVYTYSETGNWYKGEWKFGKKDVRAVLRRRGSAGLT